MGTSPYRKIPQEEKRKHYLYLVNLCQTMSALCLKLLNLMQMATCEASTIALISKGETEVRRVMVTCTDQSVR